MARQRRLTLDEIERRPTRPSRVLTKKGKARLGMTWRKASQRTVKCRACGVRRFYVYVDDESGTSELRDAGTGHRHDCGKTPAVPTSTGVRATAPDTIADRQRADLAKMIPSRASLDTYIPRKLYGHSDVDIIIGAYRRHVAHMTGTHVPTCPKDCLGKPVNVLLVGDTQTGKNHLLRAACAKLGIAYLRYNFHAGVTYEGMFGKLVLPEAGRTDFADGLLTQAARYGETMIVLDEINACPNEVAIGLHSMLDAERLAIIADKPETFRVAPTAFFVGTMNPDYSGTRPLNAAFRARFDVVLPIDYDDDVERKIVGNPTLLRMASALRTMYRSGDGTITTPVSTTLLMAHESNRAQWGPEAAREIFLAAFETPEERAAVRESYLTMMTTDEDVLIDVDKDVNLASV